MYTIKEAAARSGVSEPLLRAWERRYAVVETARSKGGYRLYDDAAIVRLRTMRALVDAGWRASQAAEAIRAGTVELELGGGRPRGGALDGLPGPEVGEALVAAAAAYDPAAIETAIDDLLARGSFEAVVDDQLLPAVVALGTAWADGRIDVAAEHLASAAVQRRLSAFFDLAGRPGGAPSVVVGLPPGCRHEIGALAFAVALRRRGVDVLYVGADTPISAWRRVVADSRAAAAVLGVPRRADVGPARDVLRALAAAHPGLHLATGGAAATRAAGSSAAILPVRVTDAAAALAQRLLGR